MAIITGTNNADVLIGGEEDDSIFGLGGNDNLQGNAGNDILDGGVGADRMAGGVGDDTYHVDNTNDRATERVDEGWDTVRASVNWTLGNHIEVLELVRTPSNTGVMRGWGNDQDNSLVGSNGIDYLWGGGGHDGFEGGGGNDRLYGEDGNDFIGGGEGNDLLEAGRGDDFLAGEAGNDVMHGNAGNDSLDGSDDFDDDGIDEPQRDELWGDAGNDWLYGDELDILRGGVGNDSYAGAGTIIERAGEGIDWIYASEFYDMADAINVENMVIRGDSIGFGNNANNLIRGPYDGSDGRDLTLDGRGGDDQLIGNIFSSNTYTGGAGRDTFYQTVTHDDSFYEREIVMDFEAGIDRIAYEDQDATRATRFVTAEQFHSGAGAVAQTAAHRYIYDTDTSFLYYDYDGSGAGVARVIWEIHMASGQLSHRDFYEVPVVPHPELG